MEVIIRRQMHGHVNDEGGRPARALKLTLFAIVLYNSKAPIDPFTVRSRVLRSPGYRNSRMNCERATPW